MLPRLGSAALLLGLPSPARAQNGLAESCWLPQAYVDSVLAYGPRPSQQRLLDPISFLALRRESSETGRRAEVVIFCSPYNEGGELPLRRAQLRRGTRVALPFQRQMHLQRVNGRWTTRFPDTQFYLSYQHQQLRLDISQAGRTDTVWFTRQVLGRPLTAYWTELLRLHLAGRYLLTDSVGRHQPVALRYADGQLSGWPGLAACTLVREQVALPPTAAAWQLVPPNQPGRPTIFSVVRLHRADGSSADYATEYLAAGRQLHLYPFHYIDDSYQVIVAENPAFVLTRQP
ncbi:hypothetical protein LJ737_26280 [Hymenobacter sp. 15J16-1T3B]|uniref:hypothetical protein n=1 Tax=Hymenobacter sp. 15J16-1T3B TaxID=2886941 RepID=UPI001D12DE74|nr:hypothetical protein [Hymenobacter sp. 15J16-1T3B]MCC3160772.1 hypothetical protein [Hymenobacter sp. 15J16-1T3B]